MTITIHASTAWTPTKVTAAQPPALVKPAGKGKPAGKDKTDANAEYHLMLKKAQDNLKALEGLLKSHAAQQARAPANWGFVGDMTAINKTLEDLISGG